MQTPRFLAAVEVLYATFAASRPGHIAGCPCCIADKKVDVLLRTPLRTLSAADLEPYASAVLVTVGEEADFRFFLPRIIELTGFLPDDWPSPEILLGKLMLAGWEGWSERERYAVTEAIDGLLELWLLTEPFNGRKVDQLICGACLAGLDPEPWLQRLAEPGRIRGLVSLYERNAARLSAEGQLANPHWAGATPEAAGAVAAFLLSSQVEAQMWDWYGRKASDRQVR